MNASSSECSSGCNSGWTLYFQPSSLCGGEDDDVIPCNDPKKGGFGKKGLEDEEEEEDLSMVSDASSRPSVHYDAIVAEEAPRWAARNDFKRQKMNKQGQDRDFRSPLDDTASSPAIINDHYFWKASLEIPEKRRSAHQEHFGFFHSHHNITEDRRHNQWFGRTNMKKWR